MRSENNNMKTWLKSKGINAQPMYIHAGSMSGLWRINNIKEKWYGNTELINKFNELGFRDFNGDVIDDFSGNGGLFSIFVNAPKDVTNYCLNYK